MRIVVIGNGMVGYKFCEKLLAKKGDLHFQLTVFGEESRPAYDRVHLSSWFSGTSAEELSMAPLSWYEENGIRLFLGDPVQRIDRQSKTVFSHHGLEVEYDYLVLATGSAAFVPPIPGVEKQGVFIYRTIEDLEMMQSYAKHARRGVVMGGGLLGLEAAKALLDLGIGDTHVVEFAPRLMPRQIDEAGSRLLQSKLEALGITIHTNTATSRILGEETITGLQFSNDAILEADMLVISAGIRPRDELAVLSCLETGQRGGVVVNDHMQTSDPSIFAIGECALHRGMIYGLVAPGYEMAEVVATQLTGGERTFTGFDMSTKLKLIGVDVASFGDPFAGGEQARAIVFEDAVKGVYKRVNISADGKLLLGGVLVGDAEAYNQLLQTCKNRMPLPENPEELVIGARGGKQDTGAGVLALPDEALICSCEGVTKAAILEAVENGNEDLAAVKKCCKAGTGCGGCVPMVKDLINAALKQ